MSRRIMMLGLVLGLSLGLAGQQTQAQAQELPTGAGRVVAKVQLMALTGTNEIKYKVDLIVENNAGKIPQP
jgi:hypothetical protein